MDDYLIRLLDAELDRRLGVSGGVLIEGPKACGKTATAARRANTRFQMDTDAGARMLVETAPELLLDGRPPILFDEWQEAPQLWDLLRHRIDDSRDRGLFLLTGSATPRDDARRHSGAGRFAVLQMRPMTLFETGHSSGEVSLAKLFEGQSQIADGRHASFVSLVERIVVGGWPDLIGADERMARDWLADYISNAVEVDVQSFGARRDPRNVRRLLASLARSVGQAVTNTELAADVGGADGPISPAATSAYLEVLERLYLTENSPAWLPHMRSRTRLRSSPVRYFSDPSLGPAALGIGTAELMADPNALGFHFEALVMRDLRAYSQALRGVVESWRDANGNEVDAVVSVEGNRWGAFEVKLNPASADQAAAALRRFADSVDHAKHGPPSILGVITGTGVAHRRSDGVHVIPISTLGP